MLEDASPIDSRKTPYIRVARLDEWCVISDGPTSEPFMMQPRGYVCRGMRRLVDAAAYAERAKAFFNQNGAPRCNVYVVQGPTSTTSQPYEVVSATAGYAALFKASGASDLRSPLPAMRHLIVGVAGLVRDGDMVDHPDHGPILAQFDRTLGWHGKDPSTHSIITDLSLISPRPQATPKQSLVPPTPSASKAPGRGMRP